MKEYIDARNLPNPQPLVYTKRALAGGEFSHLIVHVNNEDARESVVRFAHHAGFPVKKVDSKGDEFYITIANTEETTGEGEEELEEESPENLFEEERPERGAEASRPSPTFSAHRPDSLLVLSSEKDEGLAEKIFAAIPSAAELPSHVLVSGTILRRIAEKDELRDIACDLAASGLRLLCEEGEMAELGSSLENSVHPVPADELVGLLLRARKVVSL